MSDLNEPQARAVAKTEGPLLVFAGAGSGKTRVITYRVAHLVATHLVPPYRILAVTFTNKAAGEMRARLNRLVGEDITRDLWVGTFHATCARLLRRYGKAADLDRNFLIYDDADQRAVVNRVLKELDLDERRYPVRMVLSRIHKEKQEGRSPEEMVRRDWADDQVVKLYERYEQHLHAANAVDFEDLILRMTRIAESESPEGEDLRHRFRYVLVDEFQDTNQIQYRLVRQLVKHHHNLCVVGDDDQSIYRWRGADVRNIRGFKQDFPEAEVVKLEQNYRSTARIVRAALAVIKPSRDREPKELWTANEDGAKVTMVATSDERDEAAFVVSRIRELAQAGVSLQDIAVFYRVHAQSRVLEEVMRTEKIPYQIVGGTKFFERAEVKDLLSYLRVLINPRSDVDLLRIINVPARGIGSTTIDRVMAVADQKQSSLFDALEPALESSDLGSAAKKKIATFRSLLKSLMASIATERPSDAALRVLEETGYKKGLTDEDTAESDARLENLAELVGSIMEYEMEAQAAGEAPTIAGYLERVTLSADVDQMKDAPRLVLMTVHSAKGLEFRAVFLTGMEDEVFPYKGLAPGEEEELEEERRLAYVALTRARERLYLSHAGMRMLFGQTRYNRPSRFLLHLPPGDVEQIATRAAPTTRFIDRPTHAPAREGAAWRHPMARSATNAPVKPGERYVDREAFDDVAHGHGAGAELERGARVRHARFGEGEVRRVEHSTELMVIAFFPGWGEKKILARFLVQA
ncbi:MAG TPA: UvrD-helicase domain-containing protein [Polyangiaceae bacterium]|nr:UvrD-helicase domain-containing protein [Polyangiaceae bacterium]